MNFYKRIVSVLLAVVMILLAIYGSTVIPDEENTAEYNDSIIVWYTDEAFTDYLNACAVEFHEKYGMIVIPKIQSGSEYVESIYEASINGKDAPDVYILTDDALEKAYMCGCASRLEDERNVTGDRFFSTAAIKSCVYKGNKIAYPYYFETSALLYNKTYLWEEAQRQLEAEKKETEAAVAGEKTEEKAEEKSGDKEKSESSENTENTEGEAADTTETEEQTLTPWEQQEIEKRVMDMIPQTFDELLGFADGYNTPADMETILKWDVKDIFYNYFFIGNYIDIGGFYGDDDSVIDIYNTDSVEAMRIFQALNQFFAFEYSDITYSNVIEEFMQGKMLYTTATTDIIATMKQAKEEGLMQYDFGLAPIPDLNDRLQSKSLSVTNCLVINGYSNKRSVANAFARFLTVEHAYDMYDKTGRLPANNTVEYEGEEAGEISVFHQEYEDSTPMPKMMSTSNFWLKLESTMANIWGGKPVSMELKALSEEMKRQITGNIVEEEYIPEPGQTESVEYLDEEALRQEAMEEGDME